MDLFLGRRFFNLGFNIFNYAILRAALNEVDPITLIRRITCFTLYYTGLRCSHESSCVQWTPLAWLPPFPRSPDCAPCRWTLWTRRSTWSSGSSSWHTLSWPCHSWSGRHIIMVGRALWAKKERKESNYKTLKASCSPVHLSSNLPNSKPYIITHIATAGKSSLLTKSLQIIDVTRCASFCWGALMGTRCFYN